MINRLRYYESDSFDPYHNLAAEEALLEMVEPGQIILYLWQNERTVVIGRNQNCWKECKVNNLEADGGFLARRLSGGGAVFHDLGNLNFTFLTGKEDYDIGRQLSVILEGLKSLGIAAKMSGRNDLTVDDRKFSGNAFYQKGNRCYHHGTILLAVDRDNMSRYLNVSREKLYAKGVSSVRSRVVNLTEFKPDLTIDKLKAALRSAFETIYQGPAGPLENQDGSLNQKLSALVEKYQSDGWKYNQRYPFDYEFSRRFSWGEVQFCITVKEGIIYRLQAYSDSLHPDGIEAIKEALEGCCYQEAVICEAVERVLHLWEGTEQMTADIINLVQDSM